MSDQSIDAILNDWPFDSNQIKVRRVAAGDRDVLQLRLDLGLLQMEIRHRPDGTRPHGQLTYWDYLRQRQADESENFSLSPADCLEIDREFVQYYHRRVCWLHLQEFANAVRDADHSLRLMDFCLEHSNDEEWTLSHEQYRPFVLYHRTQAAALMVLEADEPAAGKQAIEILSDGLSQIHQVFIEHQNEEMFSEDELVQQLQAFMKSLQLRFGTERDGEANDASEIAGDTSGESSDLPASASLEEQLRRAVGVEDYERAARLRDLILKRDQGH